MLLNLYCLLYIIGFYAIVRKVKSLFKNKAMRHQQPRTLQLYEIINIRLARFMYSLYNVVYRQGAAGGGRRMRGCAGAAGGRRGRPARARRRSRRAPVTRTINSKVCVFVSQ